MDQHSALLPWLSPNTEIGRKIVDDIVNGDGYVVIRGVLSDDECAEELDRMWNFVETVSPTVKREDPKSWYPNHNSDEDPWPHTQKDRFQLYQAV